MTRPIHFIYEQGKSPDDEYAQSLIGRFNQTSMQQAEIIVGIGGDGTVLRALRLGGGKPVCGIVPPGSSSRGFWANKDIENADQLEELINGSSRYTVKPLEAAIEFEDGQNILRYGYNDIAIQGVHSSLPDELRTDYDLDAIDMSAQSALLNLRASFSEAVIGPVRIMGTGLIFATPMGSTAMTRNYGGPSIDIRNNAIVLTGMGTTEPVKGFNPVVAHGDTEFSIEILSSHKRPVRMSFDSFVIVANENKSPIRSIRISMAHDHEVPIILGQDPGIRAFSAMLPS